MLPSGSAEAVPGAPAAGAAEDHGVEISADGDDWEGRPVDLPDRLTPPEIRPPAWHIEVHQFRIEARPGQIGKPTPEGMHRDGVDWVLVLMVRRENIASGETTIYDLMKRPLGSFTLTAPLDTALVDDSRVYHGVTSVVAIEPAQPAYRDVLVVTFRRE